MVEDDYDFKLHYAEQHLKKNIQKNNTSGYKGVSWDEQKQKWRAKIDIFGKTKRLGRFDSKEEAAMAYNQAAIELHGEFAVLNEIRK